jgi:transposase
MIPRDFQPWESVYGYFRAWVQAGIWEQITDFLRAVVRLREGKEVLATAGIIDSQTAKSSCQAIDAVGYDGGKKIKGRKRHLVVDTLGLPLAVVVHSADIQDRDGAKAVFDAVMKKHSLVRLVYADGGYRGPRAETAAGLIDLEIVKRTTEGFSVIKKRVRHCARTNGASMAHRRTVFCLAGWKPPAAGRL